MSARAVVTGGSRGLGAAIARALAADGFTVRLTYQSRADDAQRVVAEIERAGGTATCAPLDLGDLRGVEEFARECAAGEPTVLVNNAGDVLRAPVPDVGTEELTRSLAINCTAPYLLARAVAPGMTARGGGTIVNISTILAVVGGQDRVAYTTSKAALIGLTKALAVELAPAVRVNAVLPGLFATDLNAGLLADEQRLRAITDRVPLGRLGTVEELAGLVAFLASPGGAYVTGVAWEVDGGVLARIALPMGDPR